MLASALAQAAEIRFGLIADVQYCDAPMNINRFYQRSLPKLEACIRAFNAEQVDFTVNLGDLVDRDTPKNLPPVLERLNQLQAPLYNTTGNHDYQGVTDNATLYRRLGMPASYYSFAVKNWRFIMLNTNEIASYSLRDDSPQMEELKALRQRSAAEKRKNGATYNGGIGKAQLAWLQKELLQAKAAQQQVILFSHHPLYAATGLTALDDREILALISGFTCVKAVISGHHHSGAYGTYASIPCITTEGMVETKDETAYAIVELSSTTLKLIGKGRSRSYEIPLTQN